MTHFFLCIGIFFFSLKAAAQALPIIEKNGQQYYQYQLQEGQTLYQLQALTKLDADQLLVLNPGLERGVVAGNTLIFPVLRGTIYHKVQPEQTLFAVSRKYEVPVDSLMRWNPSARAGLKVGQSLRIQNVILPFDAAQPQVPVAQSQSTFPHKLTDTIIRHTVLEKETLYSISKRYMVSIDTLLALNNMSSSRVSPGQQIKVPIQEEKPTNVPVQVIPPAQKSSLTAVADFPVAFKELYNIAVFLPLQLDSSTNNNRFVAAAALDYYMGMKLALDSLKKLGFAANVHVFDDNSISPSLEAQLNSPQMKSMDLIFSPLQEKQAKIVAIYAKENGIPVVFPVQMPAAIVQKAPNFIAYTTPDALLIQSLAAQIHKQYQGYTVVLISSPIAADQNLEQQFKTAFGKVATTQSKLKLQEATWATYPKFKPIGGPQLLVSFSSDRAKVVGLLKAAALDSNLLVVGQKDWLDYKELDDPAVRNEPFLVALPSYFNYHATQIIPFHKTYRRCYNADLTKMSCLGYDLTLHIGKQLLGSNTTQQGLISNMALKTAANGLSIENSAAVVVTYRNAQLLAPKNE
jgi:LysM repeat protein/ABC-type branched-subunit amino acid transport system substrate-binding protein